MAEEKSRDRTRNWNFILYPESAPENWVDQLDETHIEWVCSPLHDRDLNPDGEPKKAHYHVTLLYPSHKTYDQVRELTVALNAPIPIKCQSVKGSIRYMVHKDNPEKFQYEWSDIKCHGGADIDTLCAATATERIAIQQEILAYIRKAGIIEFEDIVNHALDEGLTDWLNVLLNYSTMSINAYVASRRHKATFAGQRLIVLETGETAIAGLLEKKQTKAEKM